MEVIMFKKILLLSSFMLSCLHAGQFASDVINCELGQKEVGEGKWHYACTAMACAGATTLFHTPYEQLSPADIFYTIRLGGDFYNTFNTREMLAPDDVLLEQFNHFLRGQGGTRLGLQPLKIGVAHSSVNAGMNIEGVEDIFTFHHLISDLTAAHRRLSKSVGAIITITERSYALVVKDDGIFFFDSHHNALDITRGAMVIKFTSSDDALEYLRNLFNGYEFTVTFIMPQDTTFRRAVVSDEIRTLYENVCDISRGEDAQLRSLQEQFDARLAQTSQKTGASRHERPDVRLTQKGQYEYAQRIPALLEEKNFEEAFARLDFLRTASRCFFSAADLDRFAQQIEDAFHAYIEQGGVGLQDDELDKAIAMSLQPDAEDMHAQAACDEMLALSLSQEDKEIQSRQMNLDELLARQFQDYEESKK